MTHQKTEIRSAAEQVFYENLHTHINPIDEFLAEAEVSIEARPFVVVMELLKMELLTPKNVNSPGDKFSCIAVLFKFTIEWYRKRYGKSFADMSREKITSMVFMRGDFFRLEIPLYLKLDNDDGTFTVTFPHGIHTSESISDFLSDDLPFADSDIQTVNNITETVNKVRRIARCIGMSSQIDDKNDLLRSSFRTFSQAAESILRKDWSQVSDGIWLAFFAVEKILKFRLYQLGVEPPKTHNLTKLIELINEKSENELDLLLIGGLPSSSEVINYRYGEMDELGNRQVLAVYTSALNAIVKVAEVLDLREHQEGELSFTFERMAPTRISLTTR